jgi:serine/threonine-protein kinase
MLKLERRCFTVIGEIVSHYKILEKLGEGARGVVYKAEDTKLDRFVALKFLPADMKTDAEKKERFIREAKTASALDHANICTVHEIGETNDGRMYICMAFCEGETLKEKIEKGPLKLEQAIDAATQIAQGMEKAHRKGIVHRDIKPQNLILTNDGMVKIVDFGLAKLVGQKDLTKEGITVGTVGYMSPEQARGEDVDHQTDIWSLGVVIYEMITGRLPFKGENAQAVIYSILSEQPEPITGLRSMIPPELERIVTKCLSKKCSRRYQRLDELIVDLSRLKEIMTMATAPTEVIVRRRIPRTRSLRFFVLGILCAIIIMGAYFFFDNMKTEPSIVVLPFKDISPDQRQEYLCDGIVDELITALTRIKGLRVVSRTSSFQYKGKDVDVRKIGKELNVKTVLEGSVRKVGEMVVITARLINASNGYQLWGEKYRGKLENVFTFQDEIAERVVNELKIELGDEERESLIKRYTENSEAYTLYLKGRHFWAQRVPEDLLKGIEFFRKAIEKDPGYALAYVGLADSYHLLASYSVLPPKDAFPKAKEAALKALEIDEKLGEAHNSLAAVKLLYDWDWPGAEKEFKRALELNPNYYTAHEWYAIYLAVTGKIDEAVAEMKHAAELEPLFTSGQIGIARHLYFAKKFDAAIEQFKRALESDPNSFWGHAHLGQAYIAKSRYPKAITHFTRATMLTGGKEAGMLSGLGYAHAVSDNHDEARQILNRLLELSNQRYVPPFYIAGIYIGLGDRDRAFQWLEKAYTDRSEWLIYLNIEHMLDPIREDPRFDELVKKVGLASF